MGRTGGKVCVFVGLAALVALVTVAAVFASTSVASSAAAPPTAYLAPLKAHQAKLRVLRREIDRLRGLEAPATAEAATARAGEIRRAGMDYLVEGRAFSRTLAGFVAGGTRRGLDVEVETIRATVGEVLATVDVYRVLAGAKLEQPTKSTPSVLEQQLRSAFGVQLARRIPNKLVAQGVQRMLAGASFQTVVREMLDQARQNAYAMVDSRVRSVTGVGLRDLRDLGRAIRLRANLEVDRLVTRLLVRVTGNELVLGLAREFVLPWLKAQLTTLMRPHRPLDRRVSDSTASLRRAVIGLDGLPPEARLSTVHARWQEANAALAATRFLVADIKRAHKEVLLAEGYGEALQSVANAMDRTRVRFLLQKEDLVQTLAVDRDELHGLLTDLGNLVGHVLVPAASPPQLETELLSSGGSWTFGRVNGAVLCTITLTTTAGKYGAYVLKACNVNESYWKLVGRVLYFFHADGTRTSRLTRVNASLWQGPYLGHPDQPSTGTIHYIRR